MTQGGTGVTQGECEVAFSGALAICSRRLALVLSLSPPLPVTSAVPLPVLPASHLLSFPQFLAGIQKKSPRRPYLLITVQRTGQRHWIPVCTGMTEVAAFSFVH